AQIRRIFLNGYGVLDVKTYDDKMHEDEELHIYDRGQDDEYVHDEEMKDDENADEVKDDQVMDDADKVESEKTTKEKHDDQQAGIDQTAKDDQAGAHISKTQKKMSAVPPTSSSRSLSSNYGNQFLNVSSDTSLVGIVKNPADTKINSLLDVQIQQEIPSVLSAPLLDVLVSVIPPHTIPTPTLTTPLPTLPIISEAPTITTTIP
ncbi:hypothetical protein Tco_1490264, partial [Tanacetum coccineum]